MPNHKMLCNALSPRVVTVYMSDPFDEGQGGGVRYVKNLTEESVKNGSDVLFLGVGASKRSVGGLSFVPILNSKSPSYIQFLFFLMVKLPFIDLSQYDTVHVHRLYFAIPFFVLKPKLKVVCTLHGRTFSVLADRYGKRSLQFVRPIFSFIERRVISKVHRLIPVSEDVRASFVEKYPYLMHKREECTTVIGSMVDLTAFSPVSSSYFSNLYGSGVNYVLFLGRLSAVKDIEFLITLWAEKFQTVQDVRLVIVGEGELGAQLRNFASRVCTSNEPIFHGAVSPIDVPSVLGASSALVLCSHHEASPTVVKEALSSGVPVVSNEIGDVAEFIVNDKNGFIVKKTLDDYYQALIRVLSSPLPPSLVSDFSREALDRCSTKAITSNYLAIYRDLAS